MLITVLVENTSISSDLGCEHGLSLFIKSDKYNILFDVGESALSFQNAKKLNVNITDVDFLIISHGHYDHGGGLKVFLEENAKANVYVHRLAFEKYYSERANKSLDYIGLDQKLKTNKRIIFTSDHFDINDNIQVFSNVVEKVPRPKSNKGLFVEHEGQIANDTFAHEQNLVIEEDGKTLLLVGCAHKGIVNILEHFYSLKGITPNYVVGGFHLSSRSSGNEDPETIDEIAEYLMDTKAKFYTCHCTGLEPYRRLRSIMGERIDYLSTGCEITLQ